MTALILFLAALAGGFVFPWWWPAVAAYAVGCWLPRSAASAFLSGFAGPALAWAGLAGWLDERNHHLLSGRMAVLFHLPAGWALIAVTGLIGGLLGGLGAWAGYALRAYFKPRPPKAVPTASAAPPMATPTAPPASADSAPVDSAAGDDGEPSEVDGSAFADSEADAGADPDADANAGERDSSDPKSPGLTGESEAP